MVYRVNVYIPENLIQEKSNEVLKLYDKLNISNITRVKCDPDLMISARVTESYLNEVTNGLEEIGVGLSFGIMDVIDLLVTVPAIKKTRHKTFRANSRPLRSLRSEVSSNAGLSMDYIFFTIVASIISGMGLASDSSVAVVASMLVSPLMGPIMGFTIGVLMRDKKLLLKSLLAETIGIFLCFLSGFIIGIIVIPIVGGKGFFNIPFPTEEMEQRGMAISLVWGLLIAIPSGVGVAISQTLNSIASLVGVAISAALLPPIVNSGMNFSAYLFGPVFNPQNYPDGHGSEAALKLIKISGWSMLLFIENMSLIIIFAMIILICKRVRPIKKEHRLYQGLSGITHVNDTDYDLTAEGATLGLLNNEKKKEANPTSPLLMKKQNDSEETLLQPLMSLDDSYDAESMQELEVRSRK